MGVILRLLGVAPHLLSSMKRLIHINQHKIKSNKKTGERMPVISVKTYKDNNYCNEVEILGPSKVVYRPDNPLPCGAQCWIETESKVKRKTSL